MSFDSQREYLTANNPELWPTGYQAAEEAFTTGAALVETDYGRLLIARAEVDDRVRWVVAGRRGVAVVDRLDLTADDWLSRGVAAEQTGAVVVEIICGAFVDRWGILSTPVEVDEPN